MSEISDAPVDERSLTAQHKDLFKVRKLLKTLPNEVAPWCDALGEVVHKTTATKLSKAFDLLMPGLFSFPIPADRLKPLDSHSRVVSVNIFSTARLVEELRRFSIHSPKLTAADADKNAAIPLDRPSYFQDNDLVIGAHSLELGEGLDFYSGANSSAAYKQIRHVMNNGGRYLLPLGIETADLSVEVALYLQTLESVVGSEVMYELRDVVVIPGLPQLLIPCDGGDGDYLCITPLASGGVLAAISDSIKAFSFEQNDARNGGEDGKGLLTASCMPMVGNKQNLSGLISRVKRIYFSAPPLIDKEARSAHTLVNQTERWAKQEFQNLVRSKDDPTVRTALRNVKVHIEEVLQRSDRLDPTVLDATSPNERAYEINAIKFMARPLVQKWLRLCTAHTDLVCGTDSDLADFNVAACGGIILGTLTSAIGIAVSEHTKSVWEQAIYCEIHGILKTTQEGKLCGSR
jgi:hypothetical protein